MSGKNGNGQWKNRIVGHGMESPEQLLGNPLNARIHPAKQQAALAGSLNEVGYVQRSSAGGRCKCFPLPR